MQVMLRNLGHDVPWTLMEAYQGPSDPRLAVRDDEAQLWKQLENLVRRDDLCLEMNASPRRPGRRHARGRAETRLLLHACRDPRTPCPTTFPSSSTTGETEIDNKASAGTFVCI